MPKQKELFYKISQNMFSLIEKGKLSLLAVNVYMLISDRQRLTHFEDENGKYAIFTVKELQIKLGIKWDKHITDAIKELTENKYLVVIKKRGVATKYYVKST